VNVNAAPLSIEEYKVIKAAGLGTYQIFQETYHHATYAKVHPAGTLKSDYKWRLYALHRAQEAGIDDVAIGALFGLYDWRFEVLGLLYHAIDLEKHFGIGPHTVSFPRLEPASNTPLTRRSKYKVSDDDFKKLVAVLRLSIPYAGMILTARESAKMRRSVIPLGITQTDASTKIGIGAYSDRFSDQELKKQQFLIGDPRSLDEVIRELAERGTITSFCTAGYRCSRTGKCIMDLLKAGKERWFCKTNAVLTFQEWLNDFATPETKAVGEKLVAKEIEEIKTQIPNIYPQFTSMHERIKAGERDLYF
jgi:2-iminoacetate synthase